MKKIFYYALCLCVGAMSLAGCSKNKSNDPDSEGGSTSAGSGTLKGHKYVDMGLSVKWATCNVGATNPEEYGDYFAWGETSAKSDYSWSTYKYGSGNDELTKYCTDADYGTVDNKTTLELMDDAARVNWGGSWRMPTQEEWEELITNTNWTWGGVNGVMGYTVTSNKNGNSIFLPAAGNRYDTELYYAGGDGYYWSSSLGEDGPDGAWVVNFGLSYFDTGSNYRDSGHSVRPVVP